MTDVSPACHVGGSNFLFLCLSTASSAASSFWLERLHLSSVLVFQVCEFLHYCHPFTPHHWAPIPQCGGIKGHRSRTQEASEYRPRSLFIDCVLLALVIYLPGPQLPHLQSRGNNAHSARQLRGSNGMFIRVLYLPALAEDITLGSEVKYCG